MALQKPRQIETAQSEALITLSPKLQLNVNDIIGQQIAAFGMPGFGKTNAAVLTCEQIGQYYVPMAVFDKEGDWLSMAGVLPRGVIAKRDNCPTGRDILNKGLQVIYDLSSWDSLASAADMIVSVVHELMAWASARPSHERVPCLIVLDEAHTFLPEKRSATLPKQTYMDLFDTFQAVGSTGRKRGLTPFFVSPKISELNKGVLYPGLMYFFRATLHTDVARYLEYIHSNMYKPDGLRELIASLPKGKAIVKLPNGGNTSVKFDKRQSEHVSHTPTVQSALNRYASMPFDANGSYGMDMPASGQVPEQVHRTPLVEKHDTKPARRKYVRGGKKPVHKPHFTIEQRLEPLLKKHPECTNTELAAMLSCTREAVRKARLSIASRRTEQAE